MYVRQVLGPAFLHIMILAAGDRLVLEMQYCLSFSSAAGGKICCQKRRMPQKKKQNLEKNRYIEKQSQAQKQYLHMKKYIIPYGKWRAGTVAFVSSG